MSKVRFKEKKGDQFIDLEKVRLECIQEKIEEGLQKFEGNYRKQWIDVRFSKPLLQALLDIVKKEGVEYEEREW